MTKEDKREFVTVVLTTALIFLVVVTFVVWKSDNEKEDKLRVLNKCAGVSKKLKKVGIIEGYFEPKCVIYDGYVGVELSESDLDDIIKEGKLKHVFGE
jgi:thioredoxin-related protein